MTKREHDESEDGDHETPEPPPPPKKLKVLVASAVGFEDLDGLPIDIIMGFLSVRSLLRLTSSCKRIKEFVKHEHVVRSAMISGGHSKTTIMNLVDLALKERRIFLPSPLRMLRLTNGVACESSSCSSMKKVNHCRSSYGLFLCSDCLHVSSSYLAFVDVYKSNLLDECRVAYIPAGRSRYILTKPFVDSTGESAGPIITKHVDSDVTPEGLKSYLKKVDAEDKWGKELRESVINCYEQAKLDRKRIEMEKMDGKKKREAEKGGKLTKMLETVRALMKNTPYRDTVLRRASGDLLNSNHFRCGFTRQTLGEYWRAPSKSNAKRMKEVAQSLDRCIGVIVDSGFHNLSFLSSDVPVEARFKELSMTALDNHVGIVGHFCMSNEVVELISKDQPHEALKSLLDRRWTMYFHRAFVGGILQEGGFGRLTNAHARILASYCAGNSATGAFQCEYKGRASAYRKLLSKANEFMKKNSCPDFEWSKHKFHLLRGNKIDELKVFLENLEPIAILDILETNPTT